MLWSFFFCNFHEINIQNRAAKIEPLNLRENSQLIEFDLVTRPRIRTLTAVRICEWIINTGFNIYKGTFVRVSQWPNCVGTELTLNELTLKHGWRTLIRKLWFCTATQLAPCRWGSRGFSEILVSIILPATVESRFCISYRFVAPFFPGAVVSRRRLASVGPWIGLNYSRGTTMGGLNEFLIQLCEMLSSEKFVNSPIHRKKMYSRPTQVRVKSIQLLPSYNQLFSNVDYLSS